MDLESYIKNSLLPLRESVGAGDCFDVNIEDYTIEGTVTMVCPDDTGQRLVPCTFRIRNNGSKVKTSVSVC